MQFTGLSTGNPYGGVARYPYDININEGPNQWMMCMGYYEHIEAGETWQANVASVGSLDPATHLLDYQAAFLFKGRGQSRDPLEFKCSHLASVRRRKLDAGGASPGFVGTESNFHRGEFSDVLLYSAIAGTESGNLGRD